MCIRDSPKTVSDILTDFMTKLQKLADEIRDTNRSISQNYNYEVLKSLQKSQPLPTINHHGDIPAQIDSAY